MRNIIKMLLVAEGKLSSQQVSQENIAKLDKTDLVKTNAELFGNLLNHGFLLLNATPVLHVKTVRQDAIAWHPFVQYVINYLFFKPTSGKIGSIRENCSSYRAIS